MIAGANAYYSSNLPKRKSIDNHQIINAFLLSG